MHSRSAMVLVVLVLAATHVFVTSSVALGASGETIVLAQQQPNEDSGAGEGQDEGGAGQDDPDAETGASEEETEDSTSPEATGPPWTYQMARITLVLLVLLALGLGSLYYRLVASRRKGEV